MNPKRDNLVLVGFMGTGKSTVGQALSDRLGWTFIDTDGEIEKREGVSIPEVFACKGESYFRQVESEVLHQCLSGKSRVISTGGGAVLMDVNRAVMKSRGLVIHLWADADTVIGRVGKDPNRPLLAGDAEKNVRALMEKRKSAYDFADLKVDTTRYGEEELTAFIMDRLGFN